MNKFILYLFLIFFLSNCGIDKEKAEDLSNTKIIFKKSKPINREFNQNLNINFSKLTRGEPFLGNNTNNSGNINFKTNFNKTSSYKPSIIEKLTGTSSFIANNLTSFLDGDTSFITNLGLSAVSIPAEYSSLAIVKKFLILESNCDASY